MSEVFIVFQEGKFFDLKAVYLCRVTEAMCFKKKAVYLCLMERKSLWNSEKRLELQL